MFSAVECVVQNAQQHTLYKWFDLKTQSQLTKKPGIWSVLGNIFLQYEIIMNIVHMDVNYVQWIAS